MQGNLLTFDCGAMYVVKVHLTSLRQVAACKRGQDRPGRLHTFHQNPIQISLSPLFLVICNHGITTIDTDLVFASFGLQEGKMRQPFSPIQAP